MHKGIISILIIIIVVVIVVPAIVIIVERRPGTWFLFIGFLQHTLQYHSF